MNISKRDYFQNAVTNDRTLWDYQYLLGTFRLKHLENKDLLLVGGGKSRIAAGLTRAHIKPASITNIDPFATPFEQCFGQKLISQKFSDYNMKPNTFDEEWALYSLPLYSANEGEIMNFWAKSIYGLKPNGKLRVYPADEVEEYRGDHAQEAYAETLPTDSVARECYNRVCRALIQHKGNDEHRVIRGWWNQYLRVPEDKTEINKWAEKFM